MANIISFRDLGAWQMAMDLGDVVYEVTEPFPTREWYGLAHQMRRAAVSVPSNIAEGHRRRTAGFKLHLEIALGSHGELDTLCELATRRRYVSERDRRRLDVLLGQVGRLTHGLLRSIDPNS